MTWMDLAQLAAAGIGGGGLVQIFNILLRKDSIAVATADKALDLASKAFDRERELWDHERADFLRRIEHLESEVEKLKRGA